jgi:hypothetical protein
MLVGLAEPRSGGRFGFTVFDGKARVDVTFENQAKAEQARTYLQRLTSVRSVSILPDNVGKI